MPRNCKGCGAALIYGKVCITCGETLCASCYDPHIYGCMPTDMRESLQGRRGPTGGTGGD